MKKQPDKQRGRLDFIRPRLTNRIQRAREGRMAAFVERLRVWLPAIAAGVIVALFVWPVLRPSFTMKVAKNNIPNLVIDNLHYTGVDNKNQPFSVAAAQATKPSGLRGIYDLTKPEGEINLSGGAWIDSRAEYGRYDEVGKKLWLGGNVQVFHNKGYQFTTDELQVDLEKSVAWGEKRVLLQGNFGTIRGVGFQFMNSGKTIVVKGPASATLKIKP
jgi:lipopolysaccharide export system protein LptC